ncbi:alpha/beta hydrolase, partial [Kibdelosporangium lantanae]
EGRSRADELRLLGRGDLSEAEQKQLADVRAKQNGLRAIESRLTREPPAFVLGVDVNGNGRAIIASGNPDTAVNVATFVPGTGANLGGVGGLIDRSDRMLGAAANAGSPSTAVITWVGYDAPQDLLQAGDAKYADKARGDLDRFQDGLRATHEGAPSHNTVVGHSYGTTVIGHTAHENVLNVDDVVFVGSPGVGVRHASDLNLPPGHVHATVAEHDAITVTNPPPPFLDPHGPSPASPGFGADVFASDPGTRGPWWAGGRSFEAHSQYWDQNNTSLVNMGLIIAGRPAH